ncbi:hypothetical protein SNEBB_009311 [Seison nebaliae]|nr:hypothetical protein SNEBB_009311 [Seison nebaliae]
MFFGSDDDPTISLSSLTNEKCRMMEKELDTMESDKRLLNELMEVKKENKLLKMKNRQLHELLSEKYGHESSRLDFLERQKYSLLPTNSSNQLQIKKRPENQKNIIENLKKFIKCEGFCKRLIFQKKYLLILLESYQTTEIAILDAINQIGINIQTIYNYDDPKGKHLLVLRNRRFKILVYSVIAIIRMKYLVNRSNIKLEKMIVNLFGNQN